ncbi:MAG TPA: phosphopantetheinyl transferase [Erwinia sp.]|uniref:4'-phosphopantetheinyl transferase family protein n=1 Tax=Erwinia citreus TaxID=558 RepID=UPI000E7E29EE|nr:4'-phosphopantetheinyl transferase superfamily protein [Erwinia sp.]HBV39090.1 phosphopantetheinyl transferase [Erwinia sp.]
MGSHFARWILTDISPPQRQLSQQTIESARKLPERRQTRFLTARMLLAEMLLHLYGIAPLPEIRLSPNGRPHFADPQLPDFSIAYASNIVGVLLAGEDGGVGLDMEIVRAHSRQALEQYSREISPAEKAWVQAQTDPDEAATQLWTIRQSILKLTDNPEKESLRLHPAAGRLRSLLQPQIEAFSDVEPLIIWSCAHSHGCDRLSLWEVDDAGWKGLQTVPAGGHTTGSRALRLVSLPPGKAMTL